MDDNKLDLILKKLNVMSNDINELKADVKSVKNTLNNYVMTDISNLEKGIEVLEKKAQ